MGDADGVHGGGGGHDGLLGIGQGLVCPCVGRELLHHDCHLGAQLRDWRLHARYRERRKAATALAAQQGGGGHHGGGKIPVGDEGLQSR